jgi:hypothetical protein
MTNYIDSVVVNCVSFYLCDWQKWPTTLRSLSFTEGTSDNTITLSIAGLTESSPIVAAGLI